MSSPVDARYQAPDDASEPVLHHASDTQDSGTQDSGTQDSGTQDSGTQDSGQEPINYTRRRVFDVIAVVLVALSAGLLGLVVIGNPQWPFVPGSVAAGTWLAVGLAAVLVVTGDALPVLQALRASPQYVDMRSSQTFVLALLAFAGLLPALTAAFAGILVSFLLGRYRVTALLANFAVMMLMLALAWGLLTAFGWQASLTEPWVPTSLVDLLPLLVAAVITAVLGDGIAFCLVSVFTGLPLVPQLSSALRVHLARSTVSQLAVMPVVLVVMHHVPVLTLLMVLPVTAVHRALAAEQASAHAATHDGLTQLPNRGEFRRVGARALADVARAGGQVGLVVIDLDRFKRVNDVLGHPVGDRVLVEVAQRLRTCLDDGDVAARLGGDEFCVLRPSLRSEQECTELARRVHDALNRPCVIDGRTVDVGASIGVAVAPQHGDHLSALYTHADAAMFAAKRDGRDQPAPATQKKAGQVPAARRSTDR